MRGVFEKVKRSGVWYIRYADPTGRIRREKAGTKSMAGMLYHKRKAEVLHGKKLPECFIIPKGRRGARLPDYTLRPKHSVSSKQKLDMLASQGNCCAICGSPDPGKRWHTDHDHESGDLRQILCSGCNVGLGFFRDNPARLRLAAEYLEKHKAFPAREAA